MERRYIPIRAFGRPMQVFEHIRRILQAEKLTRAIPAVKFEKGAHKEFFIFLTVQGQETTDFLHQLQTIFTRWNLKGNVFSEFCSYDDIKSMVSRGEIETHSLNALKYMSLWPNDTGDPFDLSDAVSKIKDPNNVLIDKKYDQLVHWLSASAEGTWQTFVRVCNILQLAEDVKETKSIFRRLILLGYIESSENGQKWSICPTTLVQCPTDQDVYFLTGQQSPKLIEHLKEHYDVETLPQWNFQGPSCVRVNGTFTNDVSLNGFDIVHVGTVSVQLAELVPDLEGWKDLLPAIDRLSTTTYKIEIWDGRRYILCDNFYERNGRYCGDSGLYRLAKQAENNPYQIVLYFDEPSQRWLRGDWYGLRFLTYNSAGRQFEVKYDSSANEILIPSEEHWPLLYERVLVLASGMLPVRDKNFRWQKYTNVSNELVQLLAEKLNVSIREI